MPKRYGKNYSAFLSGINLGKCLMGIAINFAAFRAEKKMTTKDFADACGVSERFIVGVEQCNILVMFAATTDEFAKVAHFCDVAIDVRFKSSLQSLDEYIEIRPATFAEEEHLIPPETTG